MSRADGGTQYEYANGVLRNRLHLTNADALSRVEASITLLRIGELEEHPLPGQFDLEHLKAIHRYIFQDIYAWAGELREVDIIKGDSRFAHFRFLISSASVLFSQLAAEHHLQGLPKARFAERAAIIWMN